MSHDCGTHRAGSSHDEELRDVDQGREAAGHQDHHPAVRRYDGEDGDLVGEGDGEHEHDGGDGGLV